MCGIFGKLYFQQHREEKRMLMECLKAITHRGPDDTGYYQDNQIFLGSTRLSIIDLTKYGNMPIGNEDGRFQMVFNGEVYNYRELKRTLGNYRFRSDTDTEVVLHLYERYGPECLHKLRGMFAFAIWDAGKQELFLARDQLGKKPLKYYYDGRFFIFASELKAILKDPSIPKQIDPDAVDQFLTYQYVPSPRTGFKNIRKLEPAHYLIVKNNGEMVKRKYWEPRFLPKTTLAGPELEEAVLDKLKQSVKLRLHSDVPLGAHLSGGVDSSLIVALMAKQMRHPVKTFSVGFAEPGFNELPYARLVAEQYGTQHHEIIAGPELINELPQMAYQYEEPYADPSLLPTWALCRETKKEVTVALNGDGGDENFAGYLRYKVFLMCRRLSGFPMRRQCQQLAQFLYGKTSLTPLRHTAKLLDYMDAGRTDSHLYARLVGSLDRSEKNGLYTAGFRKTLMESEGYDNLEKYLGNMDLSPIDRLLFTDIKTYLGEDLLTKVDIAGMAYALEVRSPFLDQEFMELTAHIPDSLKLRGLDTKYLLKKIARRYIPAACIDRDKKGFGIPLRAWMQGKWQPKIASLADRKLESYGIVDRRKVKLLSRDINSHYNSLWTLLMLKEWLSVWF